MIPAVAGNNALDKFMCCSWKFANAPEKRSQNTILNGLRMQSDLQISCKDFSLMKTTANYSLKFMNKQ